MQGYCDVYKWTILKRTSPEVKCLHLTSSRREMCTSSVSNVIYHKFSLDAAFCTRNGKKVNVMLESLIFEGNWRYHWKKISWVDCISKSKFFFFFYFGNLFAEAGFYNFQMRMESTVYNWHGIGLIGTLKLFTNLSELPLNLSVNCLWYSCWRYTVPRLACSIVSKVILTYSMKSLY